MELQENIKDWIKIDNEIKSLNIRIKELRDTRQPVYDNIIEHIEANSLLDATVKISDGRLKFIKQKQTNPLTLKYVEQCLRDKIESKEHIECIMGHIKESRDTKVVTNIKRFYD